MSPDHSSTIGNEKRTNEKLEYGDAQAFISATASLSTPRPPTTARVVALNRGPFVGAPGTARAPRRPRRRRPSSTFARRRRMRRDTSTGRSTFPSPARRSRPAPDSFSIRTSESSSTRPTTPRRREAARGLRAVGFLELAGYVTEVGRPRRSCPWSSTSWSGCSSKAPCRCSTCARSPSATRVTSPARCTSRSACCADSGRKA